MASTRTPQQARSQRRRDALLQAAVELVAEGGPQAVTHRAVAARAGLPASTAGYFFTSIDELAAEALRVYTARTVSGYQSLAENAVQPGAHGADRLIQTVAHTTPDLQLQLARAATYLGASRNPALRAPVAEALEAWRQTTEDLLKRVGVPRAAAAAPMVLALLDGFMLHRLAKPDDPPDPKLIADALGALLGGHLMTGEERRAVKARVGATSKGTKVDRKSPTRTGHARVPAGR